MSSSSTISVRVQQVFKVSAERVFDAWLDPVRIGRWMFGAAVREEEVLHIEVDARTNGRFSFLVGRNGEEIDHVGTYLELDRPGRLVFTLGIRGESGEDASRVTVDIVPDGPGCVLSLTHEMDARWAGFADRSRDGWAKMLAVLAGSQKD